MLIVGIAGGTGSGKTTVVEKIIGKLPEDEVVVVPQDSYYKDIAIFLLNKGRRLILIIRVQLNFHY